MNANLYASLLAVCLATGALAAEPPNITRCQAGAADILGNQKAFAIQVCNLFGGTCFMNHPAIASANCATEALSIASGTCKLYPIFHYADNAVRSGSSAVKLLSTEGNLGCSVIKSGGTYGWNGACVSVQCHINSTSLVGPGKTGSLSGRAPRVTNTATATWTPMTMASISSLSKQLKTVFLYRTGNYVGIYRRSGYSSSGGISYTIGMLPTAFGNNYGPVACPSSGNSMTSLTASAITKENLRMCGSTSKWVYWNAVNLLRDDSLYASYSGNTGMGTRLNIGSVPFLYGMSKYKSGTAMDDRRQVFLHSTSHQSSAINMTSETIVPDKSGASSGQAVAGTWRNYGVVFYCDDYARTDLTVCGSVHQKMFYVADPNPNAVFGTTAAALQGGGATTIAPGGTTIPGNVPTTKGRGVASTAQGQAIGIAALAVALVVLKPQ